MGFPTEVGRAGGVGGDHGVNGSAAEDDDKDGEEDGEGRLLINACSHEKAEVAKDHGTGSDMNRSGFPDEEDHESCGEGGDPGDGDDIPPSLDENGGTKDHEGEGISDEMVPAVVKEGGEEDSFPMGPLTGMDAIAIKSASEEETVDDLHGP